MKRDRRLEGGPVFAEMNPTLLALLAIIAAAAYGWRSHVRHRLTVGRLRRAMWDHCLALLADARVVQQDIDFPALHGRYKGYRVILEAIADDIGYRKLPQLWLRATIFADLPVPGVMDYLVRPENIEFYSGIWSLPASLPIPPDWPQHALLRTSDSDAMFNPALLTPHMSLFEQPQAKELLVSPAGVRVVYQLAQGERAYYAVFRSLRFANLPVRPEPVSALLERMLAIILDLQAPVGDDRCQQSISATG